MDMPQPNPAIVSRKAELVERLHRVLPDRAVISDPMETRAYECDALTAYKCPPLAVTLPASTQEVSTVLRICHEEGVPVVPRGSGTSLAGGALPTADSVVLGVARMAEVLEVDYDNRLMRVQTHSRARWFEGRANQSAVRCPLRIESELRTHRPDHEHHVRVVGLHVIGRVYHAAFDYHAEVGDVAMQGLRLTCR